jgi:glucokinase
MRALGIDIGGTNIRAGVVTPDGTLSSLTRQPGSRDPEAVLTQVVALVERLGPVDAIGVGIPGRVDARTGAVMSGGYVDLSRLDFAARLAAATGLPVAVENDATMALIAEARLGAARGCENVVLLTLGTGIGGAVQDGGQIVRGRASAGQLGHIALDPAGPPCPCGRRGCFETLASGSALRARLDEAGLPSGIGFAEARNRATAGDKAIAAVIEAWVEALRAGIDSLIASFDPDCVVLGGGLGAEAAEVLAGTRGRSGWFDTSIRPAMFGDDAGVIGAGLAALSRLKPRRRAVLVNGVPASGKTRLADLCARLTGWPVLGLDTVKDPFLAAIGTIDRPFNRRLGVASLGAMADLVARWPDGATVILDAWFGFQPLDVIRVHLDKAGIDQLIEVWAHAAPETIGARYAARTASRPVGHPGLEYVPELVDLARRARPTGLAPVLEIDTEAEPDLVALSRFLSGGWAR